MMDEQSPPAGRELVGALDDKKAVPAGQIQPGHHSLPPGARPGDPEGPHQGVMFVDGRRIAVVQIARAGVDPSLSTCEPPPPHVAGPLPAKPRIVDLLWGVDGWHNPDALVRFLDDPDPCPVCRNRTEGRQVEDPP